MDAVHGLCNDPLLVCVCVWLLSLSEDDNVPAKMLSYNRANRAVAILCNHQRAVPKNFSKQMENLQTKVANSLKFTGEGICPRPA